MDWILTVTDTSKKQADIITAMRAVGTITASDPAAQGICFTLTLHTINKYIKGLNSGIPGKAETFQEKYTKVYNHCTQISASQKKHCDDLLREYNNYTTAYAAGPSQTAVILNAITGCGFDVTLQHITVTEHENKGTAAANIAALLEGNRNIAILLCLNAQDSHHAAVGHTVAIVREGNDISYLDVSTRMVLAEVNNGTKSGTILSTHNLLDQRILVDLPNRTILNVTYASVTP